MKNLKLAFAGVALSAIMLLSACGDTVEKVDFTHGTISGTTYTNEMIGVKADFSDGWTYLSDEDLAAMNSFSDFSKESTDKAFSSTGIVYEMYAMNGETNDNLNILFENLERSNNTSLDVQGYIDANLKSLESQLQAQQFTVDKIEQDKTTFLGEETPCLKITLSLLGSQIYEYQTYKKVGQYMCVFTAMSFSSTEDAKKIIDKFTAV